MKNERVTPSFWLSEFLRSETAVRSGIENEPNAFELASLRNILMPGMQRVRELLGCPVHITSGYRSQEVERALKRKPARWVSDSQHAQGLAADFVSPQFGTPRAVAHAINERSDEIAFDQLIFEGAWVHISFVARSPRTDVLTAHFATDGSVTYSKGLA